MKVFKFGGASINSAERFINTAGIIESFHGEKLLVVISAMGKTTNALESVVKAFFEGQPQEALLLFEQVKKNHLDVVKYLNLTHWQACENQLREFFTEVEWLLHDKPVRSFDYYYDQIVCCGELLSSCILFHLLHDRKLSVQWVDVRDVIRTDNHFRDAGINWSTTTENTKKIITPLCKNNDIIITQGFIGATDENESTTLGREGSDYTAAIFAHILDGASVTIWKDVEAVMSADPKKYPEATIIPELSFSEVIEMAYYGAQVIHPKTIKPLQNKNIPLFVKSFINPALKGTSISRQLSGKLPPIIVNKSNQVLINFKSKDFSFVEDSLTRQLHQIFQDVRIKANISQHTAISLLCCFDDHTEKIDLLAGYAEAIFDVSLERNLSLLTIRHYDEDTIMKFTNGRKILLEQKTTETVQMVMRTPIN